MKNYPALRILLVEDNPGDADLVRAYLAECSFRGSLTHESDLSAACARLKDSGFAVVLLDLCLPDSQGLQTLDSIRSAAQQCAIVVLTGLSDEEVAIGALKRGAQDYLVKTEMTPPLLKKSIRHAIERNRLEGQLRHAQKMEAIGTLAGGIAHDFNNMLTVIAGYTDLALNSIGPGHKGVEDLQEVRRAAGRARDLTRQLLAFSRKQVLQPRVIEFNEILLGAEKMLRRMMGEDIEFTVVCGSNVPRIKADPGQLEQVLMNLVVNARDAMPIGGRLTLETSGVDLDADYAADHPEVTPGRYGMIAVSDTGAGMDRETVSRIFEPFFTTKEQGKGTGLGLATVHGIVRQSSGHIWVYSELGKGTTFKIYFPEAQQGAEKPTRVMPATPLAPGTGNILLVEDDPGVRRLATNILRANGYMVFELGSPEEALQQARTHVGPIHLLLTDVVMPGMSGKVLAERLKEIRPEIRVLFMSGYTADVIARHGHLDAGLHLLEKPFTPSILLRRIHETLAEGGTPGGRGTGAIA